MKYSSMGLRGTPGKLQGNPEPKIPRPPFVHPRSVPILPTEMTHPRHRSDSVNMTNSSLYQLVTKRKLSPEFAMMSHSVSGEDLSHWQSKRARREVATFESSITAQEKLSPARDSRSYPYFASEREGLTAPRRYDLNPPPLEPIVVRKEMNRAVLSSEERSLLEKTSIDLQSLFTNPNERIFPPEFGRNTAPNEVSHFRARMVYDKYVSASRSFPEESLVPSGKDLYTSYYHSYQQQGSKGHPKAKLDGLMVSSDSRRTSMDGHSGEETSRSAFHPGYPFDGSYNGLDGSSIMRDYQGYRLKNPDELRKYTERDKFHETVDAILRFRRQQGLQMTEGYLRRLPYPPGQNYQAPVQSKKDEVPNLTSNRRFVPRPQRQHQLTHTNPPLSGGPYENGNHPWSKITEDSAGKTIKHLTRNDENRNLVKGSSASKDTSAIISLAIKRIGRGRFGVLECLNNFAHQLHNVEKQWKTCRPNGVEFKTDGKKNPEDLRPLEADVSNLNDYTNRVNHTNDSVNNDAPLDLTTANGLKEDESSRGSFMEAGVAESARLPIKKRTAKYRSLSDDDVVKQHTSDSDIADISSTTSELPPVKMEVTAHESAPADESGSTASTSCDVKLEKRLRTLIETPDGEGNLPLHLAVMKNDLDVTSALVREMNLRDMSLDRYNRQKKTPLHLAIKRQNVGIIMALLSGSSSCNIPDGDGNTAIHLSVETEENFDVFRTICLHTSVPIDVSAVNRDGLNILDLMEAKGLPAEYLNLLMSSQLIDRGSDGKKIVAHVAGVKRCSPEAAEKALLGTETTSVYSEHYHMRQQQEFVRQNSDCRSAAETSKPATVAVDALAANLSPSLLYYSTSSPSAVISLPPVLSPCRPTSPLSPSSSSQLSSLSSFSASSSSPSLSISYRSPLPLSRSCLPLPSSSPTSSASLSLSPPSYGANAMSLYAVC